mgnify:CR=1 FL=1
MTTEQQPLLVNAANFRDMGGYRTHCGRSIRHGLLYRSEALIELSTADLETLRNLNIRVLFDVRSNSERQKAPNRWSPLTAVTTVNLDVSADLRANHAAISSFLTGTPSVWHAEQAMLTAYRLLPQALVRHMPLLFEHLLNGNIPLIFHCAAGKDRTGFIAALILSALGVPQGRAVARCPSRGIHRALPEANLR